MSEKHIQFDFYDCPNGVGEIIIRIDFEDLDNPDSNDVILDINDKKIKLLEISPDQWGTYYTLAGVTIPQEFETRSFLDALTKALIDVRDIYERTEDATVVGLIKENIELTIPKEYNPVIAEIMQINDLGKSVYHEVVYHNGSEWHSYAGSKTFEDGEQVLKWKYVSDVFKE
jgi:hypothetical protein